MLSISDSVAVITGGSGGMGKVLAEYWLSNGGKVINADVEEDGLRSTEQKLRKISDSIASIVCDVTSEEDNSRLASFARSASAPLTWLPRLRPLPRTA